MTENLTVETFKNKVFNYEQNEEWKFEGKLPAIIDFWAEWCGPCKVVAPVLDELSEKYNDKIKIYKVNVDEESELAAVFGIKNIPTLLAIPIDDQPQIAVGALPKESLELLIKDVLKV